MKSTRLFIAFILAAAMLIGISACAKSTAEAPVRASDILIPDSVILTGYLDIAKLANIPQIKDAQAALEQQFGITLENMKEICFWVSYDIEEDAEPEWGVAFEKDIVTDIEEKFEEIGSVEGITTLVMKEDTSIRGAAINEWFVIGTGTVVADSIRASKGANLAQSPRGKEFRAIAAKTHDALFTLNFVPTPSIKKELQKQELGEDLDPIAKDFTGASLAADYAKGKLSLILTLDSSKNAVKKAADTIMEMKAQAKDMIFLAAPLIGEESMPHVEQVYNSFIAKALGATLRISLEIGDALLDIIGALLAELGGSAE